MTRADYIEISHQLVDAVKIVTSYSGNRQACEDPLEEAVWLLDDVLRKLHLWAPDTQGNTDSGTGTDEGQTN